MILVYIYEKKILIKEMKYWEITEKYEIWQESFKEKLKLFIE